MNTRLLYLFLMVFWLFLGVALLLRDQLLPDRQKVPEMEQRLDVVAYVVMALAGWNLFRWWAQPSAWKRRTAGETVDRQHRGLSPPKDPPVTDPQFQFDRSDIPPPSPPNGSRH